VVGKLLYTHICATLGCNYHGPSIMNLGQETRWAYSTAPNGKFGVGGGHWDNH